MAYRDEAQALRARLALLEERYAALRASLDEDDRLHRVGRHHPRLFARAMFRTGKEVGRWIRARRMKRYASELEAVRARLAWFETKIAEAPLEAEARLIEVPASAVVAEREPEGERHTPVVASPPAPNESMGYRVGRALRSLFR